MLEPFEKSNDFPELVRRLSQLSENLSLTTDLTEGPTC